MAAGGIDRLTVQTFGEMEIDQLERNVDETIDECNAQVENRGGERRRYNRYCASQPSQVSLRIKGWQALLLRLLTAH